MDAAHQCQPGLVVAQCQQFCADLVAQRITRLGRDDALRELIAAMQVEVQAESRREYACMLPVNVLQAWQQAAAAQDLTHALHCRAG